MKSCFFMGHREANETLLPRLELEMDRLITEEQVRYFYVGGYGGLDQIAATAVLSCVLSTAIMHHIRQKSITKSHSFIQ